MPALDGVRGLAVLLVVTGHALATTGFLAASGAVGVTVFFVLSGYLITGLLLRRSDQGRLSWRRFYGRRVRRLGPAALVLLTVVPLLMAAVGDPRVSYWWLWPVAALTQTANFAAEVGAMGPLAHMWSLAVEEQFYLVWPVLLLGVRKLIRRDRLPLVLWTLAGAALAWRLVAAVVLAYGHVYLMLDTNAYALLIGCALAAGAPKLTVNPNVAIAGLVVLAVAPTSNLSIGLIVGPVAAVLGGCLIVTARSGSRLLEAAWVRYLGVVSYGWYLWHEALMTIQPGGAALGLGARLALALASLGVAHLSWTLIERPALVGSGDTRDATKELERHDALR